MSLNSQVVLFAIQAAVRLEGQVRQSQIDSIKNQSFKLLSPKFVAKISIESAVRWLTRDGAHTIANDEALIALVNRAEYVDEDNPLTKVEQNKLVSEYIKRKNLSEGHFKFDNDGGLSADNLYALTDVKQWENNPNPSPLQRVCGSLIEIGVDYFKNYSNAINPNSPKGKMLMSFLDAVDEVDFAEGNMNDVASRMMIATLDTLDAGTSLLSDDKNANLLLKSIAKGVINDVNAFVSSSSGNLLKQEQAKNWGQVVFKSVLNTAGETVLDNPSKFLGTTSSGASEMVTGVGNCLLSSIMEDVDTGSGVRVSLKNVFTKDTLDKVTKASFQVLAEHPEWYEADNEGVKNILNALVKELANYPNQLGMDMLPDLASMILTQTAGNLQVIYQGDPSNAANNLLIKATTIAINTLQNAVPQEPGQPWQPIFAKSNLIMLVDGVLQEVVSKPDWILSKAGNESPILEDVLASVFRSLQGVSMGSMSTETKMSIVRSAISAVTMRQDLLAKANINGKEQQLLNVGIDIVLDLAFKQKDNAKAKWALASGQAIDMMVNAVLIRVAKEGGSADVINLTKDFIYGEIDALTNGQPFDIKTVAEKLKSGDTLQELLQNSINAATRISATILAEHPELIKIENEGVRNIVNHLIQVLADFPSDINKAILPDLAMMIVTDTSSNLDVMTSGAPDSPAKNLLVLATQTVLNQLSKKDESGKVTFSYSSQQAMDLIDTVLQAVVANPTWVLSAAGESSPMLEDALAAAMQSLQGNSIVGMSNSTKISILKSSISAVALRQDLLAKANIDGNEKNLLSGSIDIALDLAFGEKADAKAKWLLMSGDVMDELVNGVLYRVAKEGASSDVLALTKEFLNGEIEALTGGGAFDIQDVIAKLKSGDTLNELMMNSINAATRITATLLSENSDRIKIDNQGVKNVVNHLFDMVANYPNDFGISILPDLATMILLDTSDNLDTMMGNSDDSDPAKNLLVLAGQTVLNSLSETDENGKPKMKFTTDQVLDLVDAVFQQVVSKPQWVTAAAGQADPFLGIAMGAVMESINGADVLKMSNDAKINILKTALTAIATDKGFMNKVGVDNKFVMTTAVNLVFKTAQGEVALPSGNANSVELTSLLTETAVDSIKWALSDNDTLEDITGAVLRRVASEGTSEQTLEMTNTLLAHEVMRIAKGEPFSVADLVSTLDSPEKLADLIANYVNNN